MVGERLQFVEQLGPVAGRREHAAQKGVNAHQPLLGGQCGQLGVVVVVSGISVHGWLAEWRVDDEHGMELMLAGHRFNCTATVGGRPLEQLLLRLLLESGKAGGNVSG